MNGAICAALVKKLRTGEGSVVDGSLMATAMWALQPGIVGSTLIGVDELPKMSRNSVPNPLVNTYRTSDGRYVIKPYSAAIVETTFIPAGEAFDPASHAVVLAPAVKL